jgi:hypothetical protein
MRELLLVLVLVGAACSGGKGPVVAPGQIVVDGDTTFRTREADAIDVLVVRRFSDREATGVATLHGMTLDDARRSDLIRIAAARAWLSLGQALTDDAAAAYEATGRGIDELGTGYRAVKRDGKHVIDDTGSKLKLAEMSAAQGDVSRAAADAADVLRSRIAIYVRVSSGSVE